MRKGNLMVYIFCFLVSLNSCMILWDDDDGNYDFAPVIRDLIYDSSVDLTLVNPQFFYSFNLQDGEGLSAYNVKLYENL